jgi:hypothetical protein
MLRTYMRAAMPANRARSLNRVHRGTSANREGPNIRRGGSDREAPRAQVGRRKLAGWHGLLIL